MSAEIEISKEVGEKCGLDMRSYQDLGKPDCHRDRPNDPDNSYVVVTVEDGAIGESAESSDLVVEGSNGFVEVEGAEDDKLNSGEGEGRVADKLFENGNSPLVNGVALKLESVVDVEEEEEQKGKIEIRAEAEIKEQVVDPIAEVEISVETGIEEALCPNEKFEAEQMQTEVEEISETSHEDSLPRSLLSVAESRENEDLNHLSSCEDSTKIELEIKESEDPIVQVEISDVKINVGKHEVVGESEQNSAEVLEISDSSNACEMYQDSQLGSSSLVEESGENWELNHLSSGVDLTKEVMETMVNEVPTKIETVDVVAGSLDSELLEANPNEQDEVKLAKEFIENVEHKLPHSNDKKLVADEDECHLQEMSVEEQREAAKEVTDTTEHDVVAPVETSGTCQGSQDVVASAVVSELQKASGKETTDELKTAKEVEENAEKEVVIPTETSGICVGSLNLAAEAVESELLALCPNEANELKLDKEAAKASEHAVPLQMPLDSDLESYPDNKKVLTEEDAKKSSISDVMENQKCDVNASNGLQKVDELEKVLTSSDRHVETVFEPVLEEKDKGDSTVSYVEDDERYNDLGQVKTSYSILSGDIMLPETEFEAPVSIESFPASHDLGPETKKVISNIGTSGPLIDGPISQIIENGPCVHESLVGSTTVGVSSASDPAVGTVLYTKPDSCSLGDENEVSREAGVSSTPPAADVSKCEHQVHDFLAISKEEINIPVTATSNIEFEAAVVGDLTDKLNGARESSDKNLLTSENDDYGNSPCENKSVALPDGSVELIAGENAIVKPVTKPFNYLIRIPRFNDDDLKEQIRLAKLQVDEKTKIRDSIRLQIQEKRANSRIHGVDYEYIKVENRSARKLVASKRMEIDSLQSMINKANNAIYVEGINNDINNMEHMMQHETLPLKNEKLLIREIKHLKQLREQSLSNMGKKDEIRQALEQKPQLEERMKILRKELDVLKAKVLKAESAVVHAGRIYDDENKGVKELQAQFKAADDERQAAYAYLQNLRKELADKNKQFFKYKDAAAAASGYAYDKDMEALYNLCLNQVEKFMKIWNTNDELRKDYVRLNARSTVRRLGTLDGRSLGPDEKPHILPSYAPYDSMARNPVVELKQEVAANEIVISDEKPMKNSEQHEKQTVENRGYSEPVSGKVIDDVHEEPVKSREEIELARKEEEIARAEAEEKLRKQRHVEELTKANEARERKKRQAEKMQMRAKLKAQKEAEQKEKEREKRQRKKERKKFGSSDISESNIFETDASTQGSVEINKDLSSSVPTKKPQKSSVLVKPSKAKAIPPVLRNRNNKKWQHYAWVCVSILVVLVLFWLGSNARQNSV